MLTMMEGNADKYYILQVVETTNGKFVCFSRWGRNGTKGATQSQGPFEKASKAIDVFEKKFKEKSGGQWSALVDGSFKNKSGKYQCVVSGAGEAPARKDEDDDEDEDDDADEKKA